MGTVHVLEAARALPSRARAWSWSPATSATRTAETGGAYRETDALGGDDPYSGSKACAELVTAAYRTSFFATPSAACASRRRAPAT